MISHQEDPACATWPPSLSYELLPRMMEEAAAVLAPYLPPTPMVNSPALSARCGRPVHLKCENLQVTGSFKVRGALARLARLEGEERRRGVVAASAGNHGLGIAWACRQLGIPGLVVVPETVSPAKLSGLQELMIKVRRAGSCYDEAEVVARSIAEEAEAVFVSPFDDPWVIAGNGGTLGRELLGQLPSASVVVAPVGGGGLVSGLGLALEGTGAALVGVNSAASPAMARSLAEGRVHLTYQAAATVAEGLEGGVSPNTVSLCARFLARMEVVEESLIREAVGLVARTHGMVLEGSAAVGVAALLAGRPLPGKGPVCVVLTGRNIALPLLREILTG